MNVQSHTHTHTHTHTPRQQQWQPEWAYDGGLLIGGHRAQDGRVGERLFETMVLESQI